MIMELEGRRQDREEGTDSNDVEEFVRARALSIPEHHLAPHNATCPPGPHNSPLVSRYPPRDIRA